MNTYHFVSKNGRDTKLHIYADSEEQALKVITDSYQYKKGLIKDGEFSVKKTGEYGRCDLC